MKTAAELPEFVVPPCWAVSTANFTGFIRELDAFVPPGSVLCLEGVIASSIEQYLKERPGPFENETRPGRLNFRPKIYFMPITAENVRELARLSESCAEPEVCSHLRVYLGEIIILSWHDLPSDPFYVAGDFGELALRSFCDAIGGKWSFAATAG